MPDFDSCRFIFIWMESREDLYPLFMVYVIEGVVSICARRKCDIREFKQIATATSTTAVVDAVSWGEYVS